MKSLPRRFPGERGDKALGVRPRLRRTALALAMAWMGALGLVSCGNAPSSSSASGPGPGTGNGQALLSTSASTLSFGNVLIGSANTQPITLTNSGSGSLSVSQVSISGLGFSLSGIATPMKLAAGQSTTATVEFAPEQGGSVEGSLSLVSNATNSPTLISLNGTGIAATLQLSASPTGLSFGNVTVGNSSTQTATLTNTGNSSLNIIQITVSGSGYTTSGLLLPATLTAGQSTTLFIAFSPTSAGTFNGTVSVVSSATNSPALISLSGTGVEASHWATLSWTASASLVIGYNAYRATASGGPYTRLNAALITALTYTDSAVQAGQTYYYAVTAVNSNNEESVYSNQVEATIPSP